MNKKIIFFDVDYTIYSHKTNSIPKSCIEGIKKAKENGYLICLATGRSKGLTSVLHIFDVIDFDYFVTINGTLVLDKNNNIIFSLPINKKAIKKIFEVTDKYNLNIALISKDDCYLYKDEDERSHKGYDPLHIPLPNKKEYKNEDIYQINLFCEDEYLKYYEEETKDYVSYSKLDNYGYDAYCKGQTKATGIKHLIDYLHIDQKDTIAFGDGHNDKEMIEFCNIGIAMGNALQKVKDVSNYITTDIDDDGIYNALKHFNIINNK